MTRTPKKTLHTPPAAAGGPRLTRRNALLTAAGGMTLLMAGGTAQRLSAAPAGQVIIGFSQEPTVMNPHLPHIEVDEGIHFNVFDPLFIVGPEGEYHPRLAAEVPTVENGGISPDGLKWRVKLREGVTWHDGTPFTAEDVKYTLELQADPDFRAMRRMGHELVRNIEIVSDHELTWEMSEPFAPYAAILSWTFIVPKHALGAAEDPNTAPFNNRPIGTGAYRFHERVAGDYIMLKANEDYFGEGPHIETVVFRYIPDLTVLYTQFRTGDIDVAGLAGILPDRFHEAQGLADREVVAAPGATMESISFNMGLPQFQEHAVRRALYHAIDKETIVSALYSDIHKVTESFMPQESFFHHNDLPRSEFNIDLANQILDEAGWERGPDGIRAKNGVRLSFLNSTTAGHHLRQQAQQFIQQSFAQIGVEMEISNHPPAVMWGEYWMMSQFETAMVGINFSTGPDPDVTNYLHSASIPAQGGAGQNTWQFVNEEVDALLEEGARNVVPEERREIYHRVQEIVREELPMLPIFQYSLLRGHRSGLEGFRPNVNVRIETWNVNEWRWA